MKTTIRYLGSLGIDMKRIVLLCLALSFLLCGCGRLRQLEKTEDGYADEKKGIYYEILEPAYQPAFRGEAVAEYVNKERDVVRVFYEIPGLDTALFVADEYLNVYFAGEDAPNAALWQLEAVLVCEEEAISVERCRLSVDTDATEIAAVKALWFGEGENAVLPVGTPAHTFQIKLSGKEYPMLYYNFDLRIYESGQVYFYDAFSRRTVLVPVELAEKLCPKGSLTKGDSQ
ncbi:MAG: hypothetical protein E7585_08870 [Ruminococcaceae bacterium]|nr:hypothetical protein [Oscillospiraceae bacterium]